MYIKRVVVFLFIIVLMAAAVAACDKPAEKTEPSATPVAKKQGYQPAAPEIAAYRAKGLPMLLDFGMNHCIPCKKMAPDLEQLHEELAGKVLVRFNNLRSESQLADQYHIRVMPTQVYVDGDGKEAFRHEGYASKADMTAKMKELGFLDQ